jgi:hypothetical protein
MQPFSLSLSPRLQTTDERYLHGESIHELLGRTRWFLRGGYELFPAHNRRVNKRRPA